MSNGTNEIVPIPLSHGELYSFIEDGVVKVFFKPAVESLGLSVESQVRKLKSRSWAWTAQRAAQLPGDTQIRIHRVVDRKTFTMWLATVNENNVAEEKREQLVTYQKEAVDALDRYFHEGGAINPRASVEQIDKLEQDLKRFKVAGELFTMFHDARIGDSGYWDAQCRRLAARVLGESPEFDAKTKPLTVSIYLDGKDLTGTAIKKIAPQFGKALKRRYVAMFGEMPPQIEDLVGRHVVSVAQYQEQHRPLFDAVWAEFNDEP